MKYILMCAIAFSLFACTQDDEIVNSIYTNEDQTGVGFLSSGSSIIVPVAGITQTVNVQATTKSGSARTYPVSVNPESTGSSADYTIGTLTIPANEYDGTLEVTFGNFDGLPDLITQTLILDLDLPADVAVVGFESTTFEYLKFLICNDLELNITPDNFASETTWDVKDSAGTVVQSGGPYTDGTAGIPIDETFTLADGSYTFTIYDSYGDGLFDGNNTGTYRLSCSIITHAAGEGNFGSQQSTDFTVN